MEIRVLNYFLAVVREESITKAAEALHITQPTLSRQLANLEEEIGTRLFERGSRKIVLTDAGRLLKRRAEEIIALSDKTLQELMVQKEQVEGIISIGAGELGAMSKIADLCGSFRKQYPRVRFDFVTANADEVRERIERGNLDLGILLEPVNLEKMEYIRLKEKEEWVVVMTKDDPLASFADIRVEQLLSLPLILPRRLNVQSGLANWFGDHFEKMNLAYTGNFSTNSALIAAKGYGYALVIQGSLPFMDQDKVICRPLYPKLTSSVVFAWKREQPMSTAMKKFVEYCRCFLGMNNE